MAVNPNTTNLAVDKDIADKLRALAKENRVTTLDITNQCLAYALDQAELTMEVRVVTLRPAGGKKKPGRPAKQ